MIVGIGRTNRRNNHVIVMQLRVIQNRTVSQETTDTQPTEFGFAFRVAAPLASLSPVALGKGAGKGCSGSGCAKGLHTAS